MPETRSLGENDTSLYKIFKYEAKQFCLSTTLHGYKFIALPRRIRFERVLWFVIVSLGFGAALKIVLTVLEFHSNTFIIIDTTLYPIWHYPFPAITICNYNKISKRKVYEISKSLDLPAGVTRDEIISDMKLLFQLIYQNNDLIPLKNYNRLQSVLDDNNIKIDTLMENLAPKCDDMLQKCRWKGQEKKCRNIFTQIKSTQGFCCSFNYMGTASTIKSPKRVSACGYKMGLEVLLDDDPDDYFASQYSSLGSQIFIHDSFDYPEWSSPSFLKDIGIVQFINIVPEITSADRSLKWTPLPDRNCLFLDEKQLTTFDFYTYNNCIVDCRINLTIKYCGCIPFYYYIRPDAYPQIRVCNLRDVPCLKKNAKYITSSTIGVVDNANDLSLGDELSECTCLPTCQYYAYFPESLSGSLSPAFTKHLSFLGDANITNQSIVRLFFTDLVATKYRKDLQYSWLYLLGRYGGILSLFVGFSFMSVIEFVYFFTIKYVTDYKKKSKKNAKGPKRRTTTLPVIYENESSESNESRSENFEFLP